jgi:putative PIN family toxin of toxin-antitoxin system
MSDPADRPRVVFDCNALVQAVANEQGPAGASLRLMEWGEIEVFLSRPVLRELRQVLLYPAVREQFNWLEDERIDAFVKRLTFRGVLIRRVPHVFDYPRARQDEPYVDLSVAAKAEFLVSNDTDLLSLMTGHSAVCKRFRQLTRPLEVLDPPSFLNSLRRRRGETL